MKFKGYMKYKRLNSVFYKYVDKYVDARMGVNRDSSTETIRFILYLDIDNIVAYPLSVLFQDYYTSISSKYEETMKFNQQIFYNQSIGDPRNQEPFSFFPCGRKPPRLWMVVS